MSDISFQEKFIEQAKAIVLENISNEQFGVSELAYLMNMSRSNLLRKIKRQTKLSASQFIRQVRLEKGMELLKQTELTASEISYQVGFGNNSYFTKCFREHYGYSPGESRKKIDEHLEIEIESNNVQNSIEDEKEIFFKKYQLQVFAITFFIIVLGFFLFYQNKSSNSDIIIKDIKKSIAVLPFKNMSSHSTNLYFVNGLMESTLNNLQKIEDLRVISRTSVEKYRETDKGAPIIAEELQVNYLVEGSGQRIGNRVLLNIQLIDALTDTTIWIEQYNLEVKDIFELQNDVAKKVVDAIAVVVKPSELEQITKKPTDNMLAYDYYLQALDPYYSRTHEGLKKAIELFKKAIEQDSEFALAYANTAISYYLLEMSQKEKKHTHNINSYADKALLYDSKSAESLVAKAFYYIQTKEYKLALPHLIKALEYNPNSSLAVQMLADFYFRMMPNTNKYLEYSLKGVKLNVSSDSITQSYTYLQLSNALISSGFKKEALKYINMSLNYYAKNYYGLHLKTAILFAIDGNIERTTKLLINEWRKDTTRLDILQDIGKFYYIDENYDSAYFYFKKFVNARKASSLDIYLQENVKIAMVYKKMGFTTEANNIFRDYSKYCEEDQSPYKSINLVWKYSYEGKVEEAIEQFRIFSEVENYPYWFILIEDDPMIKLLKKHPDFKVIIQNIKDRFWENHNRLSATLKNKRLI